MESPFWQDKRVIATGGAGFLGRYVVEKLHQRGAAEVIVPRSREYDLCEREAIRRLLANWSIAGEDGRGPRPVDMVIHLAARVGASAPTGPTPPSSFTIT